MATCDPEQLMEDGVLFQGLCRRDLEILKNQLLCEILNASIIPDAPSDGKTYARKDGAWVEV